MSAKLYDTDVFAWSAEQAELLRRLARGERVNGLDWENLIEEIETVGRSERRAVENPLLNGIVHLMKICGWPESDATQHWRNEVPNFLLEARRTYIRSMAQHIDLHDIYRDARVATQRARMDGRPPAGLPATCPFTLDELLVADPTPDRLVAQLASAAPP